ncbi:hypothetical protein [Roseibium aggregatum]|uniref:hypothetical protein n=1 Tax=Roseibium aggregatum TaxID=187304 RepID=UPI001E49255F|nr:hypothetical protein [Roseibium aggregatum]
MQSTSAINYVVPIVLLRRSAHSFLGQTGDLALSTLELLLKLRAFQRMRGKARFTAKKQIFVRASSLGTATSLSQCHHWQNPQLYNAWKKKIFPGNALKRPKPALLTRVPFLIFVWRLFEIDEC